MDTKGKFKEMAKRNDVARKLGLNVVLTNKAAKLTNTENLLRYVRAFDSFSKRDDPYGWHDLGYFLWDDKRVLWKIDYYNENLDRFEDPLSDNCKRIITIMLAEEY